MSTKISLKHPSEEGGAGFHLYRECLDFDNEFIYLEVSGVAFEAASSIELSGTGPASATIRLPCEWARLELRARSQHRRFRRDRSRE